MDNSRLDILLYGHDGRGLGHVSRVAAIGMAVRRLFPHLKVCLVTGCRQTQELIGEAPLDWIKLPAYDTMVIAGQSTGIDSPSGFADKELGRLRAEQIRQVIRLYRPRLVLADHAPQGKHRELVAALEDDQEHRPIWVLGMRGVVGTVVQTSSDMALDLYRRHYSRLLWYGDSAVLGSGHLELLKSRFAAEPVECGYVSRLVEQISLAQPQTVRRHGCTISIPWFGEHTTPFFDKLVEALGLLGPDFGRVRIFLGVNDIQTLKQKLDGLDFCSVERFSDHYLQSLCTSRCALIFGGYNSIVDVLSAAVPALVVTRDMKDGEQLEHLEALVAAPGIRLAAVMEHECTVEQLYRELGGLLRSGLDPFHLSGNLRGAEKAARTLVEML